jgi:hypothetical protein
VHVDLLGLQHDNDPPRKEAEAEVTDVNGVELAPSKRARLEAMQLRHARWRTQKPLVNYLPRSNARFGPEPT